MLSCCCSVDGPAFSIHGKPDAAAAAAGRAAGSSSPGPGSYHTHPAWGRSVSPSGASQTGKLCSRKCGWRTARECCSIPAAEIRGHAALQPCANCYCMPWVYRWPACSITLRMQVQPQDQYHSRLWFIMPPLPMPFANAAPRVAAALCACCSACLLHGWPPASACHQGAQQLPWARRVPADSLQAGWARFHLPCKVRHGLVHMPTATHSTKTRRFAVRDGGFPQEPSHCACMHVLLTNKL